MAQWVKIIVDSLMAVFFILTMVTGFGRHSIGLHTELAWILVGLIVIHLLLNWRIILAWIRKLV